jgi:alkyl hydroperoxide reductase subunit AhpC
MIELGQLERRHEDFARRNARVIVVSMEGTEDAKKTHEQFPHLLVLADEGRGLSEAVKLVHQRAAPDGKDADMPTTILVDKHGTVRWLYRPSEIVGRLSPDDVLQAIDEHMK